MDASLILTAPPSVTVRSVAAFATSVLGAADAGREVTIDVEALAECDLSFVQLVLALRTHLQTTGATLRLARPAGPALRTLLDRAGFGGADCEDAPFWFHGDLAQ